MWWCKCWVCPWISADPVLGKQRREDPWSLLVNCSCLIDVFQIQGEILSQKIKLSTIEEDSGHSSLASTCPHMNVHTSAHICFLLSLSHSSVNSILTLIEGALGAAQCILLTTKTSELGLLQCLECKFNIVL